MTAGTIVRRPTCPGCGSRGFFRRTEHDQEERLTYCAPDGHLLTWNMGLWCPERGVGHPGCVYDTFRALRDTYSTPYAWAEGLSIK